MTHYYISSDFPGNIFCTQPIHKTINASMSIVMSLFVVNGNVLLRGPTPRSYSEAALLSMII